MTTILLVFGNVVYGILAMVSGSALYYGDFITPGEFMALLSIIIIFWGIFFISLHETIKNLEKGIWR